ncbi:MAG: tetratricopeptide repeat protein [Proteobacteria bacterium]|nr:tetratricopeptide repeat protein [Pseudomonadota bacterium]
MADNTRIARMKQKAWSMLDANQPQEALAAFRECVELEPAQLSHKLELGVALYQLRHLDESLAIFDELLALDPNFILALNNKARILIDRGEDKEALGLYRRILNIDPHHIRTWIKSAQLMAKLERYDKADGCIQEGLAISPNDHELWRERAIIARQAKNLELALSYIQTSLSHKSAEFDTRREHANILAAMRKFDLAIEAYQSALRQKPDDIEIKISLAYTYLADNKPKDALDAFEAVFKTEKNNVKVWEGRGLAFIAMGDIPRGLVNRGTAAMIDNRLDDALALFDEAIATNANYPEAWSNSGVLLEKQHKYAEAAQAYRRALELDPAAVICMHNLGLLYVYHLDKRDEGLRWLKNTLKYDPQRWFKLPSELRSAVDAVKFF